MIFLRGCKRNDGRHSPQFLKRSVKLSQKHGQLTHDTFFAPKPFEGADILGVSYGNEGREVVKLTQTLDFIEKQIIATFATEQEAEAEARRLANPPEETVQEQIEDLIAASFVKEFAA